jgi:Flp pilus assembly secretin CpaC
MNCELKDFKINCFYQDSILINESLKKYLKEELAINLIESNAELIKNYSIKFKFIQIEQLDGMDLNFGLSQIESNLKEIINKPIINIIEKNSVLLKENHINISTLAEPTIVTMPKTPTTISLGSDTPFQTYDKEKNTTSTSWHFSGLKINLQLLPIEDRVKMEYESELTKVSDENTSSGSKGKSSIIVKLNTPYRLFEVNMKTIGKNSEELPLISKFPILGELFKSKSNSENYKRIYAIIEVVENE